ncbi:MAG: BtpA/SgcQ family protein [Haloferacaceae archaeon]
MNVRDLFDTEFPVVGMVHLQPLPGSPGATRIESVRQQAIADGRALEGGGVDAILVENFGDAPFYPNEVPKHTVASMTRIATELRNEVSVPVGINVLRNDVEAALAVAAAVGGEFVRANVHAGVRATDQGIVEGRAHETIRRRRQLDADVAVFADVDVKHSTPVSPEYDPLMALEDVVVRGLADAVVASGTATGQPTSPSLVRKLSRAARETKRNPPVFVGSGVTPDTVEDYVDVADGAIVGSAFKPDGDPGAPVDGSRVQQLVDSVRTATGESRHARDES